MSILTRLSKSIELNLQQTQNLETGFFNSVFNMTYGKNGLTRYLYW
jgi:hypothetical protein